jgi:hypothetical protein
MAAIAAGAALLLAAAMRAAVAAAAADGASWAQDPPTHKRRGREGWCFAEGGAEVRRSRGHHSSFVSISLPSIVLLPFGVWCCGLLRGSGVGPEHRAPQGRSQREPKAPSGPASLPQRERGTHTALHLLLSALLPSSVCALSAPSPPLSALLCSDFSLFAAVPCQKTTGKTKADSSSSSRGNHTQTR